MADTTVKKFPILNDPSTADATVTIPDGWTIITVERDFVYASKSAANG